MQFGVSIDPGKSLVHEIEGFSSWGLDFVEVYIEPPMNIPESLIKRALLIRKILEKNNLFAVGHAPPWCDLGSPDITTRAAWIIELKRTIKCAAKLGLQRLTVHAHSTGMGFLMPEINSLVMDNMAASFAVLVETAKPHGIAIAAENTWESPKEFKQFLSKVDGLHATFDVGHAFMHGGMSSVKEFTQIPEIDHLHVHDVKDGIDHFPIGEGKLSFRQLAEFLKKKQYASTATMEIFGAKSGVKRSLDKFRDLVND